MSTSPTLSLSPVSSQASVALSALPKTTIIVNNLTKNDFIVDDTSKVTFSNHTKLSLADQIKLTILNLKPEGVPEQEQDNYFLSHIEYWSVLPFLSRIIIILRDEASASKLHQFLTSPTSTPSLTTLYPYIKVTLQENLLTRSKSFDSLIKTPDTLNVSQNLSNFKKHFNEEDTEYPEPKPHPFNAYEDLSKLGIDVSSYNDEEQLNELKDSSVKRSKSLTKTLFKPKPSLSLSIPTPKGSEVQRSPSDSYPQSPTITLDETF